MPKLTCSGSVHHFSANVANKYGLAEATILYNIEYWVTRNRINKHNFRDGRYWTYNSIPAFQKQFFYLTQKQIKRALLHLREEGVLIAEERRENPMDRTLWYSINYDILAEVENAEVIEDDETEEDNSIDPDGLTDEPFKSHRQDQMGFSTIYKYKQTNNKPNIGVQNEILHPLQQYERELKIKIPNHLTYEEAEKLENEFGYIAVKETLESLANYKKQTQYKSVYLTLKKWINKDKANKPSYMNNPLPDLAGLVIE